MIIIDVREPHEFQAGHAPGSINLPLSRITQDSHAFFQAHPDTPCLIMCLAGVRAEKARQFWITNDYADSENLQVYAGGLQHWCAQGNPVVKPA